MSREKQLIDPRVQTPDGLPKTQVLLMEVIDNQRRLMQQLSVTNVLLETNVRLALGQTEEDIRFNPGLTFPLATEAEKLAQLEAEAQAEQDRLEMEEAAREVDGDDGVDVAE